jgi:hypothetical protein
VQIVIALIVAAAGYLAISYMTTTIPIIPKFVGDILAIVLILACVFYAISTYMEIIARSGIDYDEIYIPTTIDLSNNPLTPATFQSEYTQFDLSGLVNTIDYTKNTKPKCIGSACCPDGFVYDSKKNKCVNNLPIETTSSGSTGTISGFTTIAQSYVEPRFFANGSDPSRRTKYGLQAYNTFDTLGCTLI